MQSLYNFSDRREKRQKEGHVVEFIDIKFNPNQSLLICNPCIILRIDSLTARR
jgi:hypothetical protein